MVVYGLINKSQIVRARKGANVLFPGILDELYSRPPGWKMVTMKREEVDNMREIIKFQDKKIKDITERFAIHEHFLGVESNKTVKRRFRRSFTCKNYFAARIS